MTAYRSQLISDVKTILLATDGSAYSEGAVQEAIFFAHACGVKLHVLLCLSDNPEFMTEGQAQSEQMEMAARRHLEWVENAAGKEGVEVVTTVRRSGKPHEAILEEAARLQADLVVMGRRGLSGVKKLLLGSVTAKVLSEADAKVLVVPRDALISGERILLATDGSADSTAAEANTIALAKRCPALKKIIVLSVVTKDLDPAEMQRNIDTVIGHMKDAEIKAEVEGKLTHGAVYPDDVVASITDTARREKIDLIIAGKQGRRKLRDLLLGTVTEKVVATSPCAVLVVRA